MLTRKPPETAFREALEARSFWRQAVLDDPELGFIMLDPAGVMISVNDNAAAILTGSTADTLIGRTLHDELPEAIARERAEFAAYILDARRTLVVGSVFRGVRCRCVLRLLPGDAGTAGHILWTLRRAPIPFTPIDLHDSIDLVEAQALDWGPLAPLTDDERTLLGLLASDRSIQDAAALLEWRLDTVRHLRHMIFQKLGTTSEMRLAHLALAAGLVDSCQHLFQPR